MYRVLPFVFLFALWLNSCGQTSHQKNTAESDENQTATITPVSEKAAENQLGIAPDGFDFQVVVGEGMSLMQELDVPEEDPNPDDEEGGEEEEGDDSEDDGDEAEEATDEDATDEDATDEERSICADAFGVDVETIKIAGNGQSIDLDAGEYVAVKITGNQNVGNLLLTGDPESEEAPSFAGVCGILAGNQTALNIVVNDVELGTVHVVSLGNASKVTIEVKEGAQVNEFSGKLGGNGAGIEAQGDGDYPEIPAVLQPKEKSKGTPQEESQT